MLSARTSSAHAVCRVDVKASVGTANSWIEKGDSGSAIVAFNQGGTPVILGVVSHLWKSQGEWYFAVIPNEIPWPRAAPRPAPPVTVYYDSMFALIEECQ
jgi:hypothetical protein